MAILRGGRRIGNYDIRVGLPRDRSLDNVNADARLRRKPGGNSETTINRFIAQINQGEGVARPTRYLIVIQPPQKVNMKAGGHNPHADFGEAAGINELESDHLHLPTDWGNYIQSTLSRAHTMQKKADKLTAPGAPKLTNDMIPIETSEAGYAFHQFLTKQIVIKYEYYWNSRLYNNNIRR